MPSRNGGDCDEHYVCNQCKSQARVDQPPAFRIFGIRGNKAPNKSRRVTRNLSSSTAQLFGKPSSKTLLFYQ